jgi:hypothetical protein
MSDPTLPPCYAEPVALNAAHHGAWRLLPGDARFIADEPAIAITIGEFAAASGAYPILFSRGGSAAVALTGLERANLFIEDGRWAEGAYVPAYVRRYPFLLFETTDKGAYGLAIDAASAQVARGGEAGQPLFDGAAPGAVTRQALEFCRLFNEDHQRTQAFGAALEAAGLLVDRRADAMTADGRRLGVDGFRVVDPERFAALDDATVLDWRRKGWLGPVYFHLASLQRFPDLLNRQARRALAEVSPKPAKTPVDLTAGLQ